MGCATSKKSKNNSCEDLALLLASQTPFSVGEVEALYELFSKLSNSIIADGLIQREEFQLALFGDKTKRNIFADRIFDVFDVKRDGVIEFGEFVRSLAIFHPKARIEDKLSFAFRLYDIRQSGFIERDELKEMVVMFLHESDICITDEIVEIIIDKTMSESDAKGDGKIDPEEWKEFVLNNPSVLQHMTLPYLTDLTLAFPSFREGKRRRLPPNEDMTETRA